MKKLNYLLSVLTIMIFTCAFGQKPVMELTFTANYYGQYVPLDSIYIENLTQDSDTMLYAPDTVLMLDYIGIKENPSFFTNGFNIEPNHPNPFSMETVIEVYLPEKDHLKLTVHDLLGKEAACYQNYFKRGRHSFIFYSGTGKYYVFTATGSQGIKAIKMVCPRGGNDNSCKLVYNGFIEEPLPNKSSRLSNDFTFSLGDNLRFIGYAKTPTVIDGSDVLENSPVVTTTYTFEITEGLTCPGTPTIIYEGQTYTTVQIETQCWLKENLNIGTMIQGANNQTDNGTIEKYCYEDNAANCDVYGGLYQWDEMMQYSVQPGVQGICPSGWYVPTDVEWTTLTTYLGGIYIAGGKMKGFAHWHSPNAGATNESGFTALPGGKRYDTGNFAVLTFMGSFWSSTEFDSNVAWERYMVNSSADVVRFSRLKNYGYSVRCTKY